MGKFDDDDDILDLEDRDDDDEGVDPGGAPEGFGRPGAPETEEERETRADRRKNRGKLWDGLQITQRENAELRERTARLETQHETSARQQQQNQPSEYHLGLGRFLQEDRRLREHGNALMANAQREGKPVDPQVWKQLDDALLMNDVARQEYISEGAARRVAREVADPRRITAEQIHQRYPDVSGNQQAMTWADGRYRQLRAKGAPDSEATLERALQEARDEFKLGGSGRRGSPTEGDRRRSMGVRTGGGGSDGAQGDRRPAGSGRMGRHEQKLAEAMYPHMPADKAHKIWQKEIGSKDDD